MLTTLQKLRKEYCPPLDEAVFFAIISDYDVTVSDDLHSFVSVLDTLKRTALDEENVDFDPSGTVGFAHLQNKGASESQSSPDDGSTSNVLTSLTAAFSELRWDHEDSASRVVLEDMSQEEKQTWLQNMFPDIGQFTINHLLKKNRGALDRSIDELLNISFLEINNLESDESQGGALPKGIDGFLEDENISRGRKSRSKRRPRTNASTRSTSATSILTDASNRRQNVWTSLTEDVEFVCARTSLSAQAVKSVYHANGARLAATVRALARQEAVNFTTMNDLDPLLQLKIADLKRDFEAIPEVQIFGLLCITRGIPSAAHELAEIMIQSPNTRYLGKLSGVTQYSPLEFDHQAQPHSSRSSSPCTRLDPAYTMALSAAKGVAAGKAFTSAAAAHKRGRSDHLMSGAATYYSAVARENIKAANDLNAAAANAHVAAQSSYKVLDLHGVTVADAVRISKEKINLWWDRLGDAKYAPGGGGPARDGYRIVTGIGRHSKDGAPRIGPAVSRMLVREGWKVQVDHGELIVYGKARR